MLARTPDGFVGKVRSTQFVATGQACPVEFFTRVLACDEAGLLLRSAAGAAVDESCRQPAGGGHAALMEHRLIREPTPAAADAGQSE